MIQQQFLHMYRRIQTAGKRIDNEAPATGLFRRPTFSQFGDYWKRVQPVKYNVDSKVDHTPPVSFPLLEGLYINQKQSAPSPRKGIKNRHGRPQPPVQEDLEHALQIEGVDVDGMPESMIGYLKSIHARKGAIAEELAAIRHRRLLQHEGCASVDGNVTSIARDTLYSLNTIHHDELPRLANVEDVDTVSDDGSPTSVHVQESLAALHSLVLRAPDAAEGGVRLHTAASMVRRSSMRSRGTASGVFLKADDTGSHQPLKKSISQLNPELLAAAAPKRLAVRKPHQPPPTSNPRNKSTTGDPLPHRPISTLAVDSSMAGHHYAPIVVTTIAAATPVVLPSGLTQAIPTKVIGLLQTYDHGEDAASCDDHRR